MAWPKRGPKLLATGKKNDQAFCTVFLKRAFGRLSQAESFKNAGDILALHCERLKRVPDTLVYPVFFNYRHYLELRLKEVVRYGISLEILTKDDELKKLLRSHALLRLWNKAKLVLEAVWPTGPKDELQVVEGHIGQFNQVDPKGEVFRYLDGKGNFKKLPDHISIRNLREIMEGVGNFFDGSTDGLADCLQNLQDMKADMAYDTGY